MKILIALFLIVSIPLQLLSGSTNPVMAVIVSYLLSDLEEAGSTKIMPIGDSITWDWYYGDPRTDAERSGYRSHLWYKLQEIGYKADFVGSRTNGGAVAPRFDGANEGYTGWTSYQIADQVYHWLEMNPPDVVLLHIGTNDSVHYASDTAGVEQILDQVDFFEKNRGLHIKVIVARIISLPSNPNWISRFNRNLDAMVRSRIVSGDDLEIVDMEYGAGLNYGRDLIDGIHPTNCGYEKMANVWFKVLTGRSSPGLKSCY